MKKNGRKSPALELRVKSNRIFFIMQGSFSEDSLLAFNQLASEIQGLNFGESEEDSYDFTRCVRPDGSVYGTRGKCRKGTESTKAAASKVEERASKLVRQRANQTPERKAMYERLRNQAAARAKDPKEPNNPRAYMTPDQRASLRDSKVIDENGVKRGKFGQPGGITQDPKKRRKQEALGEFGRKDMPTDVYDAIDTISNHPVLKKYHDPNASYDDIHATVPLRQLKKHLGLGVKEIEAINNRTQAYEGDIVVEDGKASFYGGS